MVVLVGVAKNCKQFFSDICVDFLNRYELQLLKWSFTILSILIRFKIPSKWSTFNKRIVSGKNFKAIWSVVYPVGMTKDFLNIFSDIIIHNSLRFSLNISQFLTEIGHKVPYMCANFERNRSMRKVSLVGLKLLLCNDVKKKKMWRKWGNCRNSYLVKYWTDFLQI